jgi:amino acid adenylation domain-containing protein
MNARQPTTRRTELLVRLPDLESPGSTARPALIGGGRTVTYGELASTVDRGSAALRRLGAQRGDRIAIWMDKGPAYAKAILAALHAGCAYVPLDGGQPTGRVGTILDDSEPIVLFTDRHHLALLRGLPPLRSIATIVVADGPPPSELDFPVPVIAWTDFLADADSAGAVPPADIGPDDLAAILYTSGSTGVPKGVKISHRNLTAFTGWARRELDVCADDVFANHASFNFDLSTFDLFVALSVGAAVWIIEDAKARDVAALVAGIQEHGVTVWYSVPSILSLLTSSGALTRDSGRSLRYVLFAGEVYPMPRLRELAAKLEERTILYNLYGPTETNVCTYHRVRPQDLTRDDPLPIGLPVGNARPIIVDENGAQLEGPDAFGELVIEGDCVTLGYWGRESEPPADQHRRQRHPTGDLVTYDEDGLLLYRGRKDRMVKLSGYRIELGEIEAVVLRHPAIADAAVLVTEDRGDARLTLFYTVRGTSDGPSLIDIKRHCAEHLPKYMIPQVASRMDELPRNANGKVDLSRLRAAPALAAAGRTTSAPLS